MAGYNRPQYDGGMKKILVLLACLFCCGCSSPPASNVKPKILVTIPPYAHFVKALVGDEATVEVFIPPGANPHTYEPSPAQIRHFSEAKMWFRTGDPIEYKMVQFLKSYPVQIVNLSEAWQEEHHDDEHDLHLWLNPLIVAKQVNTITQTLLHQFPSMKATLLSHQQTLVDQLLAIDARLSAQMIPFQGEHLFISHPALGYFCQRYGLYQLSVEIHGKDPLPQDIAALMAQLKEHPVPVLLTLPEYNNKGALLIAHQLHLPSEEIDPYVEDYFSMLTHLSQLIMKYYEH